MIYSIRHITRFSYSAPIRESIMEVRMQPLSNGNQHCNDFKLVVTPRVRVSRHDDYHGNAVHHFDIPGEHDLIFLMAESTVEVAPLRPLPETLPLEAWCELDALRTDGMFWDTLQPSAFTPPTPLLGALAAELGCIDRRIDPLSTLLDLNRRLFESFKYVPQSTRVDSTIDEAIAQRRGVCQDFTHIMIALARQLGIPCRYVSGYLFHRRDDQRHDRSEDDATHAWAEAYLPGLCWTGLDPTNNLITSDRHIRVAVGRDYGDVPPTRGVFKGLATSELGVSVRVSSEPIPLNPDEQLLLNAVVAPPPRIERRARQVQQQQQ